MGRCKRVFTEEEIFKMKKLFSECVNIEDIAKRLHTSKKNITPICGERKQPRPVKIKKFN